MDYEFTVVIERDEDGAYIAICPVLPGCHTAGDTEEEARELIEDPVRSAASSLPRLANSPAGRNGEVASALCRGDSVECGAGVGGAACPSFSPTGAARVVRALPMLLPAASVPLPSDTRPR